MRVLVKDHNGAIVAETAGHSLAITTDFDRGLVTLEIVPLDNDGRRIPGGGVTASMNKTLIITPDVE